MAVDVLALVLEIGPPEAATVLLDAGVVQSLISMLLSPSALVQQQAVGLVSIMSARCEALVSHKHKVVPLKVQAATHQHNTPTQHTNSQIQHIIM